MKTRRLFLVLSTVALLSSCGETGGVSSSEDIPVSSKEDISSSVSNEVVSSSISSETVSSSITYPDFSPAGPEMPNIKDDAEHDPGEWTFEMFGEKADELIAHKEDIKSFSYNKDTYLRGTHAALKHEILQTNYEYQTDAARGTILVGQAALRGGSGVLSPVINDDSGYNYNIQCYAEGGYLHYVEKVPEGTKGRISYDSISKNNRYNNLYTVWSANPHLSQLKFFYQYLAMPAKDCSVRYIDTSTDQVVMKIAESHYETYTEFDEISFVYAYADKVTKKLTRVDYGWYLYDHGAALDDESAYNTIRVDSIWGFDYGEKSTFSSVLLTENDVDKVYGGPAQHLVNYSSWQDGVLDEEKSKAILSNLQCFGYGTKGTRASFTIDQFVDPQSSVDGEGEFMVLGSLRGTYESKLYDNDFVETLGSATLSRTSGDFASIDFDVVIQAEANDEGMYVVEDYGDSGITSHKHTWEASSIDDVDPYIGVNPIFRADMSHPFSIAGKYGPNCPGQGDDDPDFPTNYYITSGTLMKSGNTIVGTFSKIYQKNIWTPYWTYTASFKIEDSFLSELALSVSSYYETDYGAANFESSFSFVNFKGDSYGAYAGTKLNLASYEEGTVMAKNEWLYK